MISDVGGDVRTSELFGKICNFLHEGRHLSLKTISLHFRVGGTTVYKINYEDLNMRKMCSKCVSGVLSDGQKEIHVGDNRDRVDGHQICISPSPQSRPCPLYLLVVPQTEGASQGQSL